MRSLANVLMIGILAAVSLLVSPAKAGHNAFLPRNYKKKKGSRRKYPPKQNGKGRCEPDQSLVELVVCASGGEGDYDKNRKDYDILRDLLLLSGLDPSTLSDVTVFVPDDRAFHRLAMDWGYDEKYNEEAIVAYLAVILGIVAGAEEVDGDLTDLIAAILLYHVADEDWSFDELRREVEVTTLLADDEYVGTFESEKAKRGRVRLRHGDSLITNPKIHNRFQDLKIEEGRVHVIKNVLVFEELTALLILVADELEEYWPDIEDDLKDYY